MNKHVIAVTFLSSLLSPSLAWASPTTAVFQTLTGDVLVNGGNGFEAVDADSVLNIGSDVFVADNSSATIRFEASDCTILLAAGSVTRITGADMCQKADATRILDNGMRGMIDEITITPTNYSVPPPPPPMAPGFISPYAIAGGFLAVGATTIIVATLNNDAPAPVPVSTP